MPEIAEIREIDGAIWVRVGVPGDFPSGVVLWTPDEAHAFAEGVKRIEREAVLAHIELEVAHVAKERANA